MNRMVLFSIGYLNLIWKSGHVHGSIETGSQNMIHHMHHITSQNIKIKEVGSNNISHSSILISLSISVYFLQKTLIFFLARNFQNGRNERHVFSPLYDYLCTCMYSHLSLSLLNCDIICHKEVKEGMIYKYHHAENKIEKH